MKRLKPLSSKLGEYLQGTGAGKSTVEGVVYLLLETLTGCSTFDIEEWLLETGAGNSAGGANSVLDGGSGSCLIKLPLSCPALGAGSSWKVDVNALGGLSDPDSADEEEDEYLRGRRFLRVGLEGEDDEIGDHVSVAGRAPGLLGERVALADVGPPRFRAFALAFLMTCELSSLNMRSTRFL